MKKVKVLILRTAGVNCDQETSEAVRRAGGIPEIVHINRFINREEKISDYKILVIPGGFSYGDDISAGKVFSHKLMTKLKDELRTFIKNGNLLIGICNGFQVLVKSGILPAPGFNQRVTLTYNDSGRFECRWVHLRVESATDTPNRAIGVVTKWNNNKFWTKNLPGVIELPVAHSEGKFYADKKELLELENKGQVVLRYSNQNGSTPKYPENPNGSLNDIAGITDGTGRILGLMPHPERFVFREQYYKWTRGKGIFPFGLEIFRNAVNFIKGK